MLLDTAQIQYYFDLHKAVLDTLSVVMQQEAEAFIAAKVRDAVKEENSSMTTEPILLGVAMILLIAMIICISITTIFWTRICWFFQDAWHRLKRRRIVRRLFATNYLTLVNDSCFGVEMTFEKMGSSSDTLWYLISDEDWMHEPAQWVIITDSELSRYDVNRDKQISIADVTKLVNKILGKE